MRNLILPVAWIMLVCIGCNKESKNFELISPGDSGIKFANTLLENDTMNALSFEYIYNGGGVGTADFNNDGLTDIFFTGNLTSSGLYLNRGNMKFEDVTTTAGVTTNVWCTGVSLVDINQDGWMDIYVSTIHYDANKSVPNIFFINKGLDDKGIPKFENQAADLGVADSSYTTQAAFLDYDKDGDLDMYVLTNALENYTRNSPRGQLEDGSGKSVDRLYRQDTLPDGKIYFTDVTREAGILDEGWGLGITINDFNNDNWPDIYCANDFLSSDQLYINQQDGTFKNAIADYMNHQEFNGMGIDIADLNNDALNEVVVVDMMPDDNLRQKTMFSGTGYDRFMNSLRMKYQPQYIRNVLQRNNGDQTFSDIGYQSGIYATDWSWSVLLADFDNDGLRDIFISNGYPKDITNMDFVSYSKEASRSGTEELKRKNAVKALKDLDGVFKTNFLYHNEGDFQFSNVSSEWGMDQPAYSNGAAYADFDNDGDLDLVINNINGPAHLYENKIRSGQEGQANFLRVKLTGTSQNNIGLGAKVWVYANGKNQFAEQQTQRGYMSSVDPILHFGLGNDRVDSVKVVWPDSQYQVIRSVNINTVLDIKYTEAKPGYEQERKQQTLLVEDKSIPVVVQRESEYVDYKYGQPTIPHKFSQQGPGVSVGDINGDQLDDFIVGGPVRQRAKVFIQQPGGKFSIDSVAIKDSEDIGLLLFDADNDGDNDLYCVSGSTEFGIDKANYKDRLYMNNGKGKFTLDVNALPAITSSGSCVIAEDFDHDNDLDLFVGGRVSPMAYPVAPRSYLLLNNGQGKFEEATASHSTGLDSLGMVTSALFTDFDNDGWKDLIVVGEWMPVTFFKNNAGKFTKIKEMKTGWWNSIAGGDFDNDGDIDYILGNLGRNSVLQTSQDKPVSLYAKDFDKNGSIDPFISRYIQGREYPVHYRETMTEQTVILRRILQSYEAYGKKEMSEILKFLGPEGMIVKRADWFESSYLKNEGNGNFSIHPLPSFAQSSPLFGIVVCDLNNDSYLDFLAVGNSFSEETLSGFYDAGVGVYALGNGDGTFNIVPPHQSGWSIRTDAKALAEIRVGNQRKWIVTSNNSAVRLFGKSAEEPASKEIVKQRKIEHYIGSGYLSQSSSAKEKTDKQIQ